MERQLNFWGNLQVGFMLIFPALIVIFSLMAFGYTDDEGRDTPKTIFLSNLSFLSLGLTIVNMALFFMFVLIANHKPWIQQENPFATEKIISLQDNNLVNGRFHLRSGYIEQDLYYQYMVDIGDGWSVKNKVPASLTKVNSHENDNPRVEWYKEEKKILWYGEHRTTFKIYIPEGSIIEDYNIDLN